MGYFLLGWLGGYATWAAVVPVRTAGKLYGIKAPKRPKKSKR